MRDSMGVAVRKPLGIAVIAQRLLLSRSAAWAGAGNSTAQAARGGWARLELEHAAVSPASGRAPGRAGGYEAEQAGGSQACHCHDLG